VSEAHRHGTERQVFPVDRHIVEPGGKAIRGEEHALAFARGT
jgi:hypothetical protein